MKLPSRRVQFSLLAMVAGLSITTSRAFALQFQQMIVFGDSLSDTGNDFLATSGLIPPPGAYGNGRFTDGSNSLPSTSIWESGTSSSRASLAFLPQVHRWRVELIMLLVARKRVCPRPIWARRYRDGLTAAVFSRG